MATPLVDPRIYYYVSSLKPNNTYSLSAGSQNNDWGKLRLDTPTPKYSSNNWQFFHQDGVYFLRNYDWRPPSQPPSQLEVVDVAGTKGLRFGPASNATGQQWTLSHWPDGTWKLTNALAGNGLHLGVDPNTLEAALTTDESYQHWVLAPNVGVAALPSDDQFPRFNVSTPTASPDAIVSSPSPTRIAFESVSPTHTSSTVCGPNISGGTVAGAAVGGVVFGVLLASFVALLFLRRQRRPKAPSTPPSELDAKPW